MFSQADIWFVYAQKWYTLDSELRRYKSFWSNRNWLLWQRQTTLQLASYPNPSAKNSTWSWEDEVVCRASDWLRCHSGCEMTLFVVDIFGHKIWENLLLISEPDVTVIPPVTRITAADTIRYATAIHRTWRSSLSAVPYRCPEPGLIGEVPLLLLLTIMYTRYIPAKTFCSFAESKSSFSLPYYTTSFKVIELLIMAFCLVKGMLD